MKLYSLYKQATEGDINIDPPSNPFDIVNKAKFNAWNELKGKTKEESMQDYIDLVKKLKVEYPSEAIEIKIPHRQMVIFYIKANFD